MTDKDKYAVVADGKVVDTEPTKRAANEVAKEVDAAKVVVVPVEEAADAKAETRADGGHLGLLHLR